MTKLLGGDGEASIMLPQNLPNPAATADSVAEAHLRLSLSPATEIDASPGNLQSHSLVIDGDVLLKGDYSRSGPDLVIDGPDGSRTVLQDYFQNADLPPIASPDGAMLLGKTIALLAGPQSPGEYAQAAATGQNPIGNVALLEGTGSVQRADGTTEPLAQGVSIFEDDVISTGSGSKLSLKFVDGTALSMSADARMIMDELVYDAGRTDNSMVLNLVQGSFVFVTGLVAKTGTVRADTPVATMGIRGTTPTVTVESVTQTTTFGIAPDPDGTIGSYQIINLQTGQILGTVNSTSFLYRLASANGQLQQLNADQFNLGDPSLLQNTYDTFGQPGDPGNQQQNQQDNQQNPGQRGQNENGPQFEDPHTEFANLQIDPLTGGQTVEPLQGNLNPLLNPPQTGLPGLINGPNLPPPPQIVVDNGPGVPPSVFSLNGSFSLAEDTGTTLGGFTISYPGNLSVSMTAGSTVTLASTVGLSFAFGDGVDDEMMIFTGTPQAIQNALNGATYTPTPDSNTGSLVILLSDAGSGLQVATISVPITITPVEDVPELANPVDDQVFAIGADVDFTLPSETFYEGDGDPLTLTATLAGGDPLPAWLTFDGTKFSGKPPEGFRDSIDITVTATHETDSVSDTFSIHFGNYGFESANLDNWLDFAGAEGDITVAAGISSGAGGAPLNLQPTQGEYLVSIGAGSASNIALLADFLGVEQAAIDAVAPGESLVTGGSGLVLDLELSAGDVVTFDWFFDSNDYQPFRDTAFFVSPDGVVHYLDSVNIDTDSGNVNSADSTGWQTVSFTVIEPVSGSLGFGSVNVQDTARPSFLYIDNVRVIPADAEIAPVAQNDLFFDIAEDAGRFENPQFEGNLFIDNGNGADYDPDDVAGNFAVTRVRFDVADDGFDNDDWQDVDPSDGYTHFQHAEDSDGGTFTVYADGSFSLTPGYDLDYLPAGVSGSLALIQYEITSTTDGLTDTAEASFIVTGENDDPIASAVELSVGENGSVTGAASFTDADDGDTHGFGISNAGTLGLASINGAGVISYNPNGAFDYLAEGESATDTFQYTVTDIAGASSTETVTVTVNGANDSPVAANDVFGAGETLIVTSTAGNSVAFSGDPLTLGQSSFQLESGFISAVGIGDFNNDGFSDVVTGRNDSAATRGATVWLGNGSGPFAPVPQVLGDGRVQSIAVGDLNGDGNQDMFIANIRRAEAPAEETNGADMVFFGNGDGTFADSGQLLGNFNSEEAVLGDIDGDGDLDALIVDSGLSAASRMYINDGEGDFTLGSQALSTGATRDAVFADVDGDNDLDIVYAELSGLRYQINDGAGNFGASVQIFNGAVPVSAVAAGDLDDDGDVDLVFTYSDQNFATNVFLNNGSGAFSASPELFDKPGTAYGTDVALHDFDGDGLLDIYVVHYGAVAQPDAIYLNNGAADFAAPVYQPDAQSVSVALGVTEKPVLANESRSLDVLANDDDTDGSDQLTITHVAGQSIQEGGPAVTLASGATVSLLAGKLVYDASGGFGSLAQGETGEDVFQYTVADGQGGVSTASVSVAVEGVAHEAVSAADDGFSINEDTGNGQPPLNASLFADNGNGVDTGDNITVTRVRFDSNGDEVIDGDDAWLIVDESNGLTLSDGDLRMPSIHFAANGDLVLALGNEADLMPAGETAQFEFEYEISDGTSQATALGTVTINGANDAPTVFSGSGYNGPELLLAFEGQLAAGFINPGDGTIAYGVAEQDGYHTVALAAGDLDGDGDEDVVAVTSANGEPQGSQSGTIRFLYNNGFGELTEENSETPSGVAYSKAHIVDLDNDGDNDILVTGPTQTVTWLNVNNSYFGGAAVSTYTSGQESVVVDVNDDGYLDYVTSGGSKLFEVTINQQNWNFVTTQSQSGTGTQIAVGDINNDGSVDIGLIDAGGNFQIFLNDGLGNFTSGSTLGIGTGTVDIALADFTGDGVVDLLSAGADGQSRIWENSGTGTFSAFGSQTFIDTSVTGIVTGDIDSDEDTDFVLLRDTYSILYVNVGAGQFQQSLQLFGDMSAANAGIIADFDGDRGNPFGGTVTEIESGFVGADTVTHTEVGVWLFYDSDLSDTHTVDFSFVSAVDGNSQTVAELGTFYSWLESETQGLTVGQVGWFYQVNDALLNSLGEGESITLTYEVTLDDGTDAFSHNVEIVINGADDPANVQFSAGVDAAQFPDIAGSSATVYDWNQSIDNGFAVSFWYNSNGAPVEGGLVSYALAGSNYQGFTLYAADGTLYAGAESTTRYGLNTGVILPDDNNWHHVVVSFAAGFNSTAYAIFTYVDGVAAGTPTAMLQTDHAIASGGDLVIGNLHDYGSVGFLSGNDYAGAIGEVIVWGETLYEPDADDLHMGVDPAGIGASIATHLRWDGDSGLYYDLTGSGNDAVAVGSPTTVSIPIEGFSVYALEDTATQISGLSVSDPDSDTVTVLLTASNGILNFGSGGGTHPSGPSSLQISGTLAIVNAALATLEYTGNNNYNGSDQIDVWLNGETVDPSQTILVNLLPVNDATIANTDFFFIGEDDVLHVPEGVGFNDTDIDTDPENWTFQILDYVDNGTLVLDVQTGAFVYTPDSIYPGDDSFTYTVYDGEGGSSSAVVNIDVITPPSSPTGDMFVLLSDQTPAITGFNPESDMLDISRLLNPAYMGDDAELYVNITADFNGVDYDSATVSVDADGAGSGGFEEVVTLSFDDSVSNVVLNIVFDQTGETVQVSAA